MTHEPLADQAAAEAEMQELMAAQAELSALRTAAIADAAEIERLKVGHDRYEILRKLNVVQFQKLYTAALQSHLPFDELVDLYGEFFDES